MFIELLYCVPVCLCVYVGEVLYLGEYTFQYAAHRPENIHTHTHSLTQTHTTPNERKWNKVNKIKTYSLVLGMKQFSFILNEKS